MAQLFECAEVIQYPVLQIAGRIMGVVAGRFGIFAMFFAEIVKDGVEVFPPAFIDVLFFQKLSELAGGKCFLCFFCCIQCVSQAVNLSQFVE